MFTGATIEFLIVVHNRGDTAAAPVFFQMTLPPTWSFVTPAQAGCSITAVNNADDPHFGPPITTEHASCKVGDLGAQDEKRFVLLIKTPQHLNAFPFLTHVETKSYELTAVVDPDNRIQESNENNNKAVIQTTVQSAADLAADWTGGLATPTLGMDMLYHARVRNVGDKDAANFSLRINIPSVMGFVHSNDGATAGCFEPGPHQLWCVILLIKVGDESTTIFKVRLDPQVVDGAHVAISMLADPTNAIIEGDKTNNLATLPLTVEAPADLQISGTSETKDLGDPSFFAIVTPKVHNAGPGVSPATSITADWPPEFADPNFNCPGTTVLDPNLFVCRVPASTDCFRTTQVPSLHAGDTTVIKCMAFAPKLEFPTAYVTWGTATVDPDRVVHDPNRDNNQMLIPVVSSPQWLP